MSEHVETRKKIKSIKTKAEFDELLNRYVLTDRERILMEDFYLKGLSIFEIADELSLSYWGVIYVHRNILKKISGTI